MYAVYIKVNDSFEGKAYGSYTFLMNAAPLTAEQLAKELNLPASSVRSLARRRILPVLKIGYRTHRFDLIRCREALARREVKAI